MKTLYIKSARKVLQNKKKLESELDVKISVKGTDVVIDGEEVKEYFAERVLLAMDFPFLVEDALLLKNDDYMFEVVHIKDYTHRHDMNVIRGRIIGKKGKTLKVLEGLSDCAIAVKDNDVAIIGPVETFEDAQQAVISLIHGSKQGHVYGGLERRRKRSR